VSEIEKPHYNFQLESYELFSVPSNDNVETFAILTKHQMQITDLQCHMDKINTLPHVQLPGILYSLPADKFPVLPGHAWQMTNLLRSRCASDQLLSKMKVTVIIPTARSIC
jgi:hypothetical protein